MSQQLINRSSDLARLRDEGFDVEVRAGYLVLKDVPYVDSRRDVRRGKLISELSLAGDVTTRPSTHVVHFDGDHPCDAKGAKLEKIAHQTQETRLDTELVAQHSFSAKPPGGYADYYEKMTTYASILESQAQSIDPSATAKTFPVIGADAADSVFCYLDTASSRADINVASAKLGIGKVAIVGLGGTGSYVLDMIAKTPVTEIHLFDGDVFSQHNAFRSPGAPSIDELRAKPLKVAYFKERYSRIHRGIVDHDFYITESNADELRSMDFVFLCMDGGTSKKKVVESLEGNKVPFIDVGLGVLLVDGSLGGNIRVTTSTEARRRHVWAEERIPFNDAVGGNDYDRNIQIADLNALNAALAVVKWKKIYGFYRDFEKEFYSVYAIDTNRIINEEQI
jgi:hypothetical protein